MTRKVGTLEKKLAGQTEQIYLLENEVTEKSANLSEMSAQSDELSADISRLNDAIFTEREKRQSIEANFAELTRLKEMQESTAKLDAVRTEMIEGQLQNRLKRA